MKNFTATPNTGATSAPRSNRLVLTSVMAALCAGGLFQGQAHALTLNAVVNGSILGSTAYPCPTGSKIQSPLLAIVGSLTSKEQRAVAEFNLKGLKPVKKATLTLRVTGLTGILGNNGLNLGVEAYLGNNLIDVGDYQAPTLGSQLLNTNLAGVIVGRDLTVDVTALLNSAIAKGSPSLGIRVRPLSNPGVDLGLNLGNIRIGTVDNTTPTVNSVSIKSSTTTPTTNGTLTVDATVSDSDQDKITYKYVWRKNGVVIPNETGATLDLSKPGNGDKGDKITVTVTANDGTTDSSPTTSPAITIGNSLPSISGVTVTRSNSTTNATLTANVTVADADRDPLTYSYIWKKDGVVLSGQTGATLDLSKLGSGNNIGTFTVTVTANDGTANSTPITSPGITISNIAPKVNSVLPQAASDKVDNTRTFTLTMSDGNGAGDIKEMWLLINDRLGWESGATLIYRPSATNPANGTLTLRRGDAFLPPVNVGAGSSSNAVLDNGAVHVVGSDIKASVSGNSITLTLPMRLRDGLVGANTMYAYVIDGAGATDPAALPSDQKFVRFGNYTVIPKFKGASNVAPLLSRLTPGSINSTLNSTGVASDVQTVVFAASDPDGMGDIESLMFMAGKTRTFANGAVFVYRPRDRRLFLSSDDGNSWLGGIQVGQPNSAGILENSQVRTDLSQVKVTIGGDGKTVVVSIPMQAKRGLLGQNKIWLRTQDRQNATPLDGDEQGYALRGTWNVTQGTSPNSVSAPSGGSS